MSEEVKLTTLQVTREQLLEFNRLKSNYEVNASKRYTNDEFFGLLLKLWADGFV
jgi:hypothetical protein